MYENLFLVLVLPFLMAQIFDVQSQSLQQSSFVTEKIYHDNNLHGTPARFKKGAREWPFLRTIQATGWLTREVVVPMEV